MVVLRDQAYCVTGLPNDLRIIYPQVILTSEGYKGAFIDHCHGEHDSYRELNFKEDKTGWQKAEPVEFLYIKYDPNKNLPTHKAITPNQR